MRIQYLFAIYLILLLAIFSCRRIGKDSILPPNFSIDDSVEVMLDLYGVNGVLFPILDSITSSIETCNSDYIEQLGFVFNSKEENGYIRLSIEYLEMVNIDYSRFIGMFLHNGFEFYIYGQTDTALINNKNKSIHFMSKAHNKDLINIDDSGSMWVYAYSDNALKCILYDNCNSTWFDESYFVPENE